MTCKVLFTSWHLGGFVATDFSSRLGDLPPFSPIFKQQEAIFSFLLWMKETDRLQKAPLSHVLSLPQCFRASIPLYWGDLAAYVQFQVLGWQPGVAGHHLSFVSWTTTKSHCPCRSDLWRLCPSSAIGASNAFAPKVSAFLCGVF